jgi:hypothetical protein
MVVCNEDLLGNSQSQRHWHNFSCDVLPLCVLSAHMWIEFNTFLTTLDPSRDYDSWQAPYGPVSTRICKRFWSVDPGMAHSVPIPGTRRHFPVLIIH